MYNVYVSVGGGLRVVDVYDSSQSISITVRNEIVRSGFAIAGCWIVYKINKVIFCRKRIYCGSFPIVAGVMFNVIVY